MSNYEANEDINKKLFFRLLNPAHVTIWYSLDFLNIVNDAICKELLNNCQKLKTFELISHEFSDDTPYHEALLKVRLFGDFYKPKGTLHHTSNRAILVQISSIDQYTQLVKPAQQFSTVFTCHVIMSQVVVSLNEQSSKR